MNALINGTPLTLGKNLFQTKAPLSPNGTPLDMRPTSMNDSMPNRNDPMWLIGENAPPGPPATEPNETNSSLDPLPTSFTALNVIRMGNVLSNNPSLTTFVMPVNPYTLALQTRNPDGTLIDHMMDSRILNASERNGVLVTTQEVANAARNGNNARWYAFNMSS